jgi:hypothetical protein
VSVSDELTALVEGQSTLLKLLEHVIQLGEYMALRGQGNFFGLILPRTVTEKPKLYKSAPEWHTPH